MRAVIPISVNQCPIVDPFYAEILLGESDRFPSKTRVSTFYGEDRRRCWHLQLTHSNAILFLQITLVFYRPGNEPEHELDGFKTYTTVTVG
jgi:hypothetical protein